MLLHRVSLAQYLWDSSYCVLTFHYMNMPNLLTHSTTNIHLGCFQIGQIQTVLLWIFSISFLAYIRVNAWVIRFAHDYSSTLAWKIPWTEEPGGLQSMRSLRVGHDWATSLSLFTFVHWRRKWQPTPVFLPGESQGQGSLVGCRLWGHTESDTTEVT